MLLENDISKRDSHIQVKSKTAPVIETGDLKMRPFIASDALILFDFYTRPKNIQYWLTPDFTLSDTEKRISKYQELWNSHGFGGWALEEKATGAFMGFCVLHFIEEVDEVNIGFLIDSH